ncbi:MAG TPA: hypothetical protein VK858_00105 [Longimicrobiales bacterium]|nr:hypothetical protein [Longimicrobiales bacterium]
MMRTIRLLALTGVLALAGTACADLEVTNLNDPDRERAISTPGDVEALISGGFQNWYTAVHQSYPGSALSVGADAHSSSWGNWGMRDFGEEPRKAYNNEPSYNYNNVTETPWGNFYGALSSTRSGMLAINDGLEIGQNGADTDRAVAFAKLIQGLAHGYVGMLFDRGYIVDETVSVDEAIPLSPYTDVFAYGMQKLAEAEQMAESLDFTIPSAWVGYNGDWTSDYMARFIRSYRARMMSQVGRTPSERDAADWAKIKADAESGIQDGETYGGYYDGNTWAWHRSKLHTSSISGWTRIDYRTVGPADASGAYGTWLAAGPSDKLPFDIDTDDSRITGGAPNVSGSKILYLGGSPFPADRGIYHYSNYMYGGEWVEIVNNSYIGFYPDFDWKEAEFLIAEANIRMNTGLDEALDIVNASRAKGDLPPLADAGAVAPGGDRCVPKNDGVTCGDLLESLKYEKRIELFHYGLGTEYFDDRGWGDLVSGTPLQLPIPGSELILLLEDYYTFGGDEGGAAPNIVDDISPEGLRFKRAAQEKFLTFQQVSEGLGREIAR